jgi:hypothetical protein
VDQVARTIWEPILGIGEIPRDLAHPYAVGSGKDSRDFNSAGREVDDKENEVSNEATPSDHFDTAARGVHIHPDVPFHPLAAYRQLPPFLVGDC